MTMKICRHCGLTEDDRPKGQKELWEPIHEGLHPERVRGAERVYADYWAKANIRSPGLNSGFSALEWVLCPTKRSHPEPAGQWASTVAATVVQWLGTNCGRAMVLECERRIEKDRYIRELQILGAR